MFLAASLASTLMAMQSHTVTKRPFKLGEEVIDFDEIPSLPDPVSYEVEMNKDQKTIEEMKDELHSASVNADKGSLNREMSQALIQDIKGKMSELDQHFTR